MKVYEDGNVDVYKIISIYEHITEENYENEISNKEHREAIKQVWCYDLSTFIITENSKGFANAYEIDENGSKSLTFSHTKGFVILNWDVNYDDFETEINLDTIKPNYINVCFQIEKGDTLYSTIAKKSGENITFADDDFALVISADKKELMIIDNEPSCSNDIIWMAGGE